MKILIDKCIPLNNGDAALIFSLAKQLEGEYEIEFSTTHYSTVKSIYPKYSWHKSLLGNRWYRKIFKLFPILGKFITFIYLVLMNNEYKKSDVIIAAPGGYLHSYYGIEDKLYIWHLCKKYLKKTVGLYSQSLGELKKEIKIYFINMVQNLILSFYEILFRINEQKNMVCLKIWFKQKTQLLCLT